MDESIHKAPVLKQKTPKGVLAYAKEAMVRMVDVKFVDTFGTWQHFSVPISELNEGVFEDGFGFDGSSIRGWKSIEASDMLAMPDPTTAFVDPFCAVPTLSLTCTIAETGTKEAYNRDPRGIAKRGERIGVGKVGHGASSWNESPGGIYLISIGMSNANRCPEPA